MNVKRTNKVYLIDDEEDFCEAFRDAVVARNPNLEIYSATSTEIAEKDPNFAESTLVFIDLRMPDKTGEEFLREHESKGLRGDKRFIVVSGIVRCETIIPIGEELSVTVLPKPLNIDVALSLIEEHFAESSAE